MRRIINIDSGWQFINSADGSRSAVDLPHTWNAKDGQDGGNDYYRGECTYEYVFDRPALCDGDELYAEFKGVNASAKVYLNDCLAATHDGGYSTFRARLTPYLRERNVLKVLADNSVNDRVYPQRADFTFYGGIYRDVNFIIVGKNHFDLDFFGCNPIKIVPKTDGRDGIVTVTAYNVGEGKVDITIYDGEGRIVATAPNGEEIRLKNVRLWDGLRDPYLYRATAKLVACDEVCDEISSSFGFRSFSVDPQKGFMLNGRSYPLRGVCRHQDRLGKGNALSRADHEQDVKMILDIGANTVRLAHYQHDDYFYDLCDRAGLVVWAEIPYISRHMNGGDSNAVSQMSELIYQQYNHPSIVAWGISNEITMMKTDKKDMLNTHRQLNELCHRLDPDRLTVLACFASCLHTNRTAHITDVVSWNLYLGWYAPGLFLNDVWLKLFHFLYPKRCIGYSEYGAEVMTNLHAKRPKRFDNTEEYQTIYHEYMLRFFDRHPYLWATHLWNMFDFGADGRNQGGDPGKNHKGLVTFDRQIKKDAYYLYKAFWSSDKFVHICGKRYKNREGKTAKIKVYSNAGEVLLTNNGRQVKGKTKDGRIFLFRIKLQKVNKIQARAGDFSDECQFVRVRKADPEYRLKVASNNMSWEK